MINGATILVEEKSDVIFTIQTIVTKMKTIAIAAGGNSSEYGVSIKSAGEVQKRLAERYITYVIVMRGHNWYWEDEKGRIHAIDKNDFTLTINDFKVRFDAVFIAIHGTPGEDGRLQGYFDMLSIPYTGCNVFTLSLTFNKEATKRYLEGSGIRMARSVLIRKGEEQEKRSSIEALGLPLFIKPNDSGSSFGVSKVKQTSEIDKALEDAFKESNVVLAESFMKGTEVACGVVTTAKGKTVLPVTEIVSKNEFFDYEAKYTPGRSDEITPARLPDEVMGKIQSTSLRISDMLGCRGIVRVDFIIIDDEPWFLEINTVPGMTAESIVPKQAEAHGLSLVDLYSMVIEDVCK